MIRWTLLIASLASLPLVGCEARTSDASSRPNATQGVPRSESSVPLRNLQRFEQHRRQATVLQAKAELQTLRSMCELYQVEYGAYPDFATRGWSQLTGDGYLRQEPTNPLSPKRVASRIIVISTPGATGGSVDPSTAGWVFNTSGQWGGTMHAAGVDW